MNIEVVLTAPILVSVVTLILILLHLFICVSTTSNEMVLFYDDCNTLNYRHQYIIRLLYDSKSDSYDDSSTTIIAQIDHSMNREVKIPFTPQNFRNVFFYKSHRCAKVFVRTCERYLDVRSTSLYHNGDGTIYVFSVELQDVDHTNTIMANVRDHVYNHNIRKLVKRYPFGREIPNQIEFDVLPSQNVSVSECVFILYASVNSIYMVNLLLLFQECTDEDLVCGLSRALIIGGIGSGVAFGLFVIIILPFRYLIKIFYHQKVGRGCGKFVWFTYLFITFIVGVVFGAMASKFSLDSVYETVNKNAEQLTAPYIWLVTSGFSIFFLVCMIGICIPFSLYCHFIQLANNNDLKELNRSITVVDIEPNNISPQALEKPTKKWKPVGKTRKQKYAYVKQTIGTTSSSRMRGSTNNTSTTKNTTDDDDTASVGDNYYAAMVKMAKIRSVSQYHTTGLK